MASFGDAWKVGSGLIFIAKPPYLFSQAQCFGKRAFETEPTTNKRLPQRPQNRNRVRRNFCFADLAIALLDGARRAPCGKSFVTAPID